MVVPAGSIMVPAAAAGTRVPGSVPVQKSSTSSLCMIHHSNEYITKFCLTSDKEKIIESLILLHTFSRCWLILSLKY